MARELTRLWSAPAARIHPTRSRARRDALIAASAAVGLVWLAACGAGASVGRGSSYMYWTTASGQTLWRATLSSSSPARQFISGTTAPLSEVAVSPRYIYWANGNAIGRANLDGGGVDERFITGAHFPVGVAVNSRYIYWSNNASYTRFRSTIGRANLDGIGADQRFITGTSIAVDGGWLAHGGW